MKLTKPTKRPGAQHVKRQFEEAADKMNSTRFDKLAEITRGLQLPEDATAKARTSYYTSRELFVKQCIALNYTDTEICRALKVTGRILAQIKAKIFQAEVEGLQKMSQLEHFVEYKLKQMEVVKELDVLIEEYRDSKNLQGLSASLKAKQEALKEIKSAAQDVGLLDKKPEEVIFVNGQNTKELSNEDLVNNIAEGYQHIQRLLNNVTPMKKPTNLDAESDGEAVAKTKRLLLKVKRPSQ